MNTLHTPRLRECPYCGMRAFFPKSAYDLHLARCHDRQQRAVLTNTTKRGDGL